MPVIHPGGRLAAQAERLRCGRTFSSGAHSGVLLFDVDAAPQQSAGGVYGGGSGSGGGVYGGGDVGGGLDGGGEDGGAVVGGVVGVTVVVGVGLDVSGGGVDAGSVAVGGVPPSDDGRAADAAATAASPPLSKPLTRQSDGSSSDGVGELVLDTDAEVRGVVVGVAVTVGVLAVGLADAVGVAVPPGRFRTRGSSLGRTRTLVPSRSDDEPMPSGARPNRTASASTRASTTPTATVDGNARGSRPRSVSRRLIRAPCQ